MLEIPERVTIVGYTSDPKFAEHQIQFEGNSAASKISRAYSGPDYQPDMDPGEIVRGLSGEAIRIITPLDIEAVRPALKKLYEEGYRSLAIVLAHSYTFPDHEVALKKLAKEEGFEHISLSHK